MAYTEAQKHAHIQELQGYLHHLSHVQELPHVSADGIYGVQTAEAVKKFQQQNHLHPSGETNSETWNAIVSAYQTALSTPTFQITIFSPNMPIYAQGAEGSGVFLIQALLQEIQKCFPKMPTVTSSGIFDTATENAVRFLQKHTQLPISGIVDFATWNRIVAASGVTYH